MKIIACFTKDFRGSSTYKAREDSIYKEKKFNDSISIVIFA